MTTLKSPSFFFSHCPTLIGRTTTDTLFVQKRITTLVLVDEVLIFTTNLKENWT